ncbi:YdcF family protein [Hymenobacter sp. HSC-4F20]|uniref:YdcF family protein n=1 Tax=Hymenobacter sp. HSC-4F20 TaxID=2864135 RepID=UPI001C73C653|nr:YdcF family protein [Hymenobacter sp. HSC-4F20]MBX0289364.1 YdcF family protein [Hymenobacter sp. HSC-4F20]
MRKSRAIGLGLALLVGSWVLLHLLLTTLDGLTDDVRPADCLVVLGNTVQPNGRLSERLRARLDKARELYGQEVSPLIFVSGGLGREGHYEGTAMQRYLVAHGVPPAAIVVDNAGDNTLATARNFGRLARARHLRSAVVVSQFFHLSRTKLMLRQQAVPTVYGAHAAYYEGRDAYALAREFAAYYAYLLSTG